MDKVTRSCMALACLVGAFICIGVPVAHAQNPFLADPIKPVDDRNPEEFRAKGIRSGNFIYYPSAEVREEYNDNVLATDSGTKDDFITQIKAALNMQSDLKRHAVGFNIEGDVGLYSENDDENYEDVKLNANGRIDITGATHLFLRANHQLLHVDRENPNDQSSTEPTEYDVTSAQISLRHKPARLSLLAGTRIDSFDFDDGRTAAGVVTNNDDQDREELRAFGRIGYELKPGMELFSRAEFVTIEYDQQFDDLGVERDNDGYDLVAGLEGQLTPLVFGNIFAGYRSRDYEDATLSKASGPLIGATLDWNFSEITTLTGLVEQTTQETIVTSASSYEQLRLRGEVNHELRRNILLKGHVQFINQDFEGISREDDVMEAGISGFYKLNRTLSVGAGYLFESKDSTNINSDYDINRVFLTLKATF